MADGRLGYGRLGDFLLGQVGGGTEPIREFDVFAVIQKSMEHTRSINAEIAGTNLPYLDEFTRSVDPGIGDSRYTAGDEANAYVNGSELRIRNTGFADADWIWNGAPRLLATYSFDFWVPALGDTSSYFNVNTRGRIPYNGQLYRSWVTVSQSTPDSNWELQAFGGVSTMTSNFTPDRSEWYTVKWELDPTVPQLRAKIWKRSDTEPGWQYTHTAGPSVNSQTPAIYIAAADAEEARFDNLRADEWVAPPPQTSFTLDAVMALAPYLVDFDAILYKRWEPPGWLDPLPTFVGASTATATEDDEITVSLPAGTQAGDLLLGFVSFDQEGATFGPSVSATYQPYVGGNPTSWTHLTATPAGTNHRLVSLYKFADHLAEAVTFRTVIGSSTPFLSNRVAVVIAIRGAGVPFTFGASGTDSVTSGSKSTTTGLALSTATGYNTSTMMLAAWAGAANTVTTWTPGVGVTEHADVGISLANLMVGSFTETYDNFWSARSATPSQAEIHLVQGIVIPHQTPQFGLRALLGPGGRVEINAQLASGISTKHDRMQYHFDMTPADKVYSTQAYGPFPPGTSLQDVLAGLDEMITDLESPES